MPMQRREFLLGGACALATATSRAADLVVTGTPIDLVSGARRTTAGALTYKGGLRLGGQGSLFGGLSAMRLTPDAKHLLAITDRAAWFQADLVYDESGVLVGVEHGEIAAMIDTDGKVIVPPRSDSESLAIVGNAVLVGFERQSRVLRYALDANRRPTAERPVVQPSPPAITRQPSNEGLEAMTTLADGRVLAISEGLVEDGAMVAWILPTESRAAETLHYVAAAGYNPTDATTLPDGDVLVLERRFTVLDRGARIVRVRGADIRNGARIEGEEIARLLPPMQVDNFEAIDAVPAPQGGVRIFVMSDDNFSAFQRTLLLQFWMP